MTHKPDAVEPDRVISDKHCVNCGHLYYDHLVAMNTTQTGECKHCRCYHPETASREQLWREVGQLTAERDALRREVEAVRSIAQTVISYASPMLIQMHGMSQRFDEETQRHLLDTVMQIRRSHRDLLAINKALEGESR